MMDYTREKLWDYVHGTLDSKEELEIKEQMSKDNLLRSRIKQIERDSSAIRSAIVEKAPDSFTDSVMSALESTAHVDVSTSKVKINIGYMRLIFGVLLATLISCLIFLLLNINWSASVGIGNSAVTEGVVDFLSADMIWQIIIGFAGVSFLLFIDTYLSVRNKVSM